MKKTAALLLCMMLIVSLIPSALAARSYIIQDSNTRALTEQDIWDWDYESGGYILNEIFARHGYDFNPGGKYDTYFRALAWYTPNNSNDQNQTCYARMSKLEWQNVDLIKRVRQDMRNMNTTNSSGKSLWDVIEHSFDELNGFFYTAFKPNQKMIVYTGPGAHYFRSNNRKASVSTNGAIFVAGWENGWLLIMYETNGGSVRVGYIDSAAFVDAIDAPFLQYEYAPATVASNCTLTDDPARTATPMMTLTAGTNVTYLTNYYNRMAWAYVETTTNNGTPIRGFLPANNLIVNDLDIDTDASIGK